MALDLEAPDHTTVSRRSQQVDVGLRLATTKGRLHPIVDSTGLSIIGEGEWAAVKHGGRGKRTWKKLHLGVDRSGARDRTVRRVRKVERRQWKKESGYHQQARVENTFFRYKSIIGDGLRARHPKSQKAEVVIACNILNRMTELGRPESFAIGA